MTDISDINPLITATFDVYQEIGNQLGDTRNYLLRKIISNLEAIRLLLIGKFDKEIKILLKSALETVILFCYLSEHPEKEAEYVSDTQLMSFKNNFIFLKNYKIDIEKGWDTANEWNVLLNFHLDNFKKLSVGNQEYILKKLKVESYNLSFNNFDQYDKFFRSDKRLKKPFFMDLEFMYQNISPVPKINRTLRDAIFTEYNKNSQISHNYLKAWTEDLIINDNSLYEIKSQLHRIIALPMMYVQDRIRVDLVKQKKLKDAVEYFLLN